MSVAYIDLQYVHISEMHAAQSAARPKAGGYTSEMCAYKNVSPLYNPAEVRRRGLN